MLTNANRIAILDTFTKTNARRRESRDEHRTVAAAYSTDGRVWRWVSNDNVCPLDACKEYGIPCDVSMQDAARQKEVAEFVASYRKSQRGRKLSAEERYEMRAAFGPGQTVVNVLTGRRYRS